MIEYCDDDFESIEVNAILHTNGSGLWSRRCIGVPVCLLEHNTRREELKVYFDDKVWDTDKYGLIYTDKLFLKELKEFVAKNKFLAGYDFDYSEQGMQGDDYVSLDIYLKKADK
jgi:hypothetical protein